MRKIRGKIVLLYNYFISRKWINKRIRICRKLRSVLFHNICHEWNCSFGNLNEDRTFYVIRCAKSDLGFFGMYNSVVYHIAIALQKGAEPVIDWCHYPNDYILEDNAVGKVNAWEDYFQQATDISLDEVYLSKNVIMSSGVTAPGLDEIYDWKLLEKSQKLVKKYVRLKPEVYELCENEYHRLQMDRNRILGVKCRGTDFISTKPTGHSICPSVEQIIETIEEKRKEWGDFNFIFLATEDELIFRQLKEYYGEKIIFNETERIQSTNGKWLNELFDSELVGKNCKKARMLEYLISVYLLSKCDSLIAPIVGATLGALRMRENPYTNLYLFQLGNYE